MSGPGPARRQPPIVASALRVFDLSFGEMLWSRRSVFLALLVGGPVVLAAVLRAAWVFHPFGLFPFGRGVSRRVGPDIYGMVMWLIYVRFIVPVLGVFYGTSLIADEVDDKTITYLFTRPIRRRAIVFGKYLGYLVCTALLVLPSALLTFFLLVPIGGGSGIGQEFPALLEDLAALAVGLAAYGALFAYVGARLRRPLIAGLVFAFGWEPAILLVPGYLKRLSVAYYLQALVPQPFPSSAGTGGIAAVLQAIREEPSLPAALLGLALIVLVGLWAAGRAVEQREYVLEQ
jgi:ABC-2 type transport system permease protein